MESNSGSNLASFFMRVSDITPAFPMQCATLIRNRMNIVDLASQPQEIREQAADFLVRHFDQPAGWPNQHSAREAVEHVLDTGFACAMLDSETLAGWIGGLPEYNGRVWELHPLVVHSDFRLRGIGRALVAAFESEARARGGITATLGADDHTGMTSLGGINLYKNLPRHLAEVRDLGRGHPFGFYLKLGFVITGVLPDANGPGRPDIYMSKSLVTGTV
jgi:aminoglycoside 6'-N-acetyltransferase I